MSFSEEMLESIEEQEQYRNYVCPISLKIMTDPVYDPAYPQYNIEKLQILRWLKIKEEHPFNRSKLKPEQLVSNVTLKQEIDEFVARIIKPFYPDPETCCAELEMHMT